MRTRKLTMISSIAGDGLNSSASGGAVTAGAAASERDPVALSLSSPSIAPAMSSAEVIPASPTPFSADPGITTSSISFSFPLAVAPSASSLSPSSPLTGTASPSTPFARFAGASPAPPTESRLRLPPSLITGAGTGGCTAPLDDAARSDAAAAAAVRFLRWVSHCKISSTKLMDSTRFSGGLEEGRPRRDSELTICGTNCAREG
mmetsp:Transcript_32422/g.81619  ORF Transcript_32422/g.81619 Transcript_32422/m.81619 type:complete len:204 (-) Transcript_32422:188-799(-)